MKKKLIYAILFATVISCTKEYETTTKFIIGNDSGHKITLEIYNANFQTGINLDSTIQILDKHDFSFSYTYKGEENNYLHPFGKTVDSAFVYYDDTLKVKLLKEDNSMRNVLKIESYEGARKNSCYFEYNYTFTQNDYNSILND